MKVYIGPHVNWIGPYQVADWLKYVGVSKDTCHEIGGYLADTWFGKLLTWIHSKKERNIAVHIDGYDVWNMDHTLSLIVLPMLKLIKANKHGTPFTKDEDVPEHIRSTADPVVRENEWDTDCHFHARWDYILDEMIFAFESIADEDSDSKFYDHGEHVKGEDLQDAISRIKIDQEGLLAHHTRVRNGLRLFGYYLQALWD